MTWEGLAPVFGFLLQWARAHTRFPEWAYHGVALVFGVGLVWLTERAIPTDLRDFIGFWLMKLWVTVPAIWGGTLAASQISKVSPVVPRTDSK